MPQRDVIVLTGVPGVGKTTVAGILAERLGRVHIDLTSMAKEEGLTIYWDAQRETSVADLKKICKRFVEIHGSAGKPLIVEGHFAPDVVPSESALLVFVLRRAPWRLKSELEARGYGVMKVRENVEAELLGVCLSDAIEVYGHERVCEIDTTDRASMEIVEEIVSILNGDCGCRSGQIDWLGREEAKRLLEGWTGCTWW